MKNILHVIGYLGRGGDTAVVLQVLSRMDRKQYHFDFVTHEGRTRQETVAFLREQGCRVYILPGDVRALGPVRYLRDFRQLLKNAPVSYDAVHVHTGMQSGVALLAAKRAGIPARICHSHVTAIQRKAPAVQKLLGVPVFRFLIRTCATERVGCSRAAGEFLFGKQPFAVVHNGVDTEAFQNATKEQTDDIRKSLRAGDGDIVIGMAARMNPMKNHAFALSLAEALRDMPNLRFVFLGDGELLPQLKEQAKGDLRIFFPGQRTDVAVWMKAFDCLLLPSNPGEGFPVAVLEAQAAGCPCLISDNVTEEADAGLGLVRRLPLELPGWSDAIRRFPGKPTGEDWAYQMEQQGFGVRQMAKIWLALYQ